MPRVPSWIIAGALLATAGCTSNTSVDTAEQQPDAVADVLGIVAEQYGEIDPDAHAFPASTDINGDGRPEIVVHIAGPVLCGTGGCTTVVYTPTDAGYHLVAEIAPTKPPIQVSPRETNGWRNLLVHVSGGGLEAAYDAELTYDGAQYPPNPTGPGILRAEDTQGATIVIPTFENHMDGVPLPPP
jgi:hypothetical protein